MKGAPIRLRVSGVQKRFGGTVALKNVTLEVGAGEVHALIGENGAGKSTLMKILSGACSPDAGSLELDGSPFVPANPLHARRSGVDMIYQELNLAPHLTVQENILLGIEPRTLGLLRRRQGRDLAYSALRELQHEDLPLDSPVSDCTVAEQQVVEIARALIGNPKLLIMDEPTSSLSGMDAENLFKVIRRLRERGVSIIYISHFLEECKKIADRYTVLRDGETVGSGEMKTALVSEIIHLMVGRKVEDIYPEVSHSIGAVILEVRGIAGRRKPRGVSLQLREGEILGIAGLIGAGRTETLRCIFGLDQMPQGSVAIFSNESKAASPSQRLREGMALLSENRKEEGLMLNRPLTDNLTLTRMSQVARFGIINVSEQARLTEEWIGKLRIRAASVSQSVTELSGGNQQKLALARLLYHGARILLLDEPTRGVDVGSKAEIYRLIGQLAAEGKAIIFVSSYLPELLNVCDTIAVMSRGKLSQIRPVEDWTEQSIISAAVGQPGE